VAVFRPFRIAPDLPIRPRSECSTDLEQLRERRHAVEGQYQQMVRFLSTWLDGDLSRANLLRVAEALGRTTGIVVDPSARRLREAIIVWFCEHATELFPAPPGLDTTDETTVHKQPDLTVAAPPTTHASVSDALSAILDAAFHREDDLFLCYDS
jgi:hypothetical protein